MIEVRGAIHRAARRERRMVAISRKSYMYTRFGNKT